MKPAGKGILIKKIDAEKGGLVDGVFVPASAQGDGKKRGEVVGVNHENNFIKTGDKIVYEGDEKNISVNDSEVVYLINENQILTIM